MSKLDRVNLGVNSKRILFFLRAPRAVTKKYLTEKLSLSLPTLVGALKVLQEMGCVSEDETLDNSVGRKPALVKLNNDFCYSVGVGISTHSINASVVGFAGEVVCSESALLMFSGSQEYWENVSYFVNSVIQKSKIDVSKIEGVGISIPTPMQEQQSGRLNFRSRPEDMLPNDKISKLFDYKVWFVNPAIAAGISRVWHGNVKEEALVLLLTRYIDCCNVRKDENGAIVAESRLVPHMQVEKSGKRCYCGKTGCLQTYASTSLIIDKINNIDTMGDFIGTVQAKQIIGYDKFFEELESGNVEYLAIWDDYLNRLANAIATLRFTTRSEIVVCGELSEHLARYKFDLCEKVAKLYPSFISEDPKEFLHTSVLEKYAVSAGAAMYIFEAQLLKD